MSNPNAHDIKVLNGLIETTLDSADGYREAAEQTQDPHYRSLFERRGAERQQVVEDLSAAVRGLGGDPESDGSILAKAHRAFLDDPRFSTVVEHVDADFLLHVVRCG